MPTQNCAHRDGEDVPAPGSRSDPKGCHFQQLPQMGIGNEQPFPAQGLRAQRTSGCGLVTPVSTGPQNRTGHICGLVRGQKEWEKEGPKA